MKILFDVTPLCRDAKTGIPIFTEKLYESLRNEHGINVIATPRFCRYLPTKPWKLYRFIEKYIYRKCLLPLQLKLGSYDFYIECDYMFQPLFKPNIPVATFIYDIALILYDHLQTPKHNRQWEKNLLKSINNSDILLTISQTARKELIDYLQKKGITNKPVYVIYADCDTLPPCKDFQSIKNKLHLPEHYLLVLGTIQPRKNPLNIIKGFHYYLQNNPHSSLQLVFAGRKGWLYDDLYDYIDTHKLHSKIHFTGFINNTEKSCLLLHAAGFLMLSLHEGFGLPALEALRLQKPVLLSNIPVFHELFGDTPMYTDPNNPNQIGQDIEKLLALQHQKYCFPCNRFNWQKSAKTLLRVIKDICVEAS